MHASLHELLSLRDEVIADSAVVAHVRECVECRAELDRLRAVTSELRGLPSRWTAPDRWADITLALCPGQEKTERRQPGWIWPVAAAAAVVGTVVLLTWDGSGVYELDDAGVRESPLRVDVMPDSDREDLVAESRELEQLLSTLPGDPVAMRASTALTLADLQDRIRWVDYRLAHSEEAGLEPQQSEQLWQERIDLLNSLVAVRYAQARASF
jgi:hypothetical protein